MDTDREASESKQALQVQREWLRENESRTISPLGSPARACPGIEDGAKLVAGRVDTKPDEAIP